MNGAVGQREFDKVGRSLRSGRDGFPRSFRFDGVFFNLVVRAIRLFGRVRYFLIPQVAVLYNLMLLIILYLLIKDRYQALRI